MKYTLHILVSIFIVISLYNSYKIHTFSTFVKSGEEIERRIQDNMLEIQTLKSNLETMVTFVNAKFENLAAAVSSE